MPKVEKDWKAKYFAMKKKRDTVSVEKEVLQERINKLEEILTEKAGNEGMKLILAVLGQRDIMRIGLEKIKKEGPWDAGQIATAILNDTSDPAKIATIQNGYRYEYRMVKKGFIQ